LLNFVRTARLVAVCLFYRLVHGKDWLCPALVTLGPAFIKIGQFLSGRPDIVGERAALQLGSLRDKVPPFPRTQAQDIFAHSFGVDTPFVNLEPVASASIAQVYKARLADGAVVAVKVQRPGVARAIVTDINLLMWLNRIAAFCSKRVAKLRLDLVLETIMRGTKRELDFRLEAATMEEFAATTTLFVPKVYWHYTSRTVLTMTWLPGVPIYEATLTPETTRGLVADFLQQGIERGFFHADLHAGNIIAVNAEIVGLVDFGKVGYLNVCERYYLGEVLLGLMSGDYRRVSAAHFDVGFLTARDREREFVCACRAVGAAVTRQSQFSVAKVLTHMLEVADEFGMQSQPAVMLFYKNLLLLESAVAHLTPTNIWEWVQLPDICPLKRQIVRQYVRTVRSARSGLTIIDKLNTMLTPSRGGARIYWLVVLVLFAIWVTLCVR
jgi:ubiquinone biosynthesis protein